MSLRILTSGDLSSFAPEDAPEGLVLLLDKAEGWTSFDAVNKTRNLLRKRLQLKKLKVGHAGTLDPMATGLLILCTGKYTSLLQSFQDQPKTYSGTMRLGAVTASYDRESPPEQIKDWQTVSVEAIEAALPAFIGDILQVPPLFSAIKVDGQRAYSLARRGKDVELAPRPVTVHSFTVDASRLPDLDFHVVCSKGTYIRSLAHDLGQILGCGAYLTALRREAIGTHRVENALSMESLAIWTARQD